MELAGKISRRLLGLTVAAVAATGAVGVGGAAADPVPAGYGCTGTCGATGADGVVTLSPFATPQYLWVSTAQAPSGIGGLPTGLLGSETNGSTLATPTFAGNAGDSLQFYFNYVTSDGAGFADYAWVALMNSTDTLAALLFTARTTTGGNTVPGFGMPAIDPNVTLSPAATAIIAGGPAWSPLGADSGRCYDTGCGYTGWVLSDYDLQAAGSYYLLFGVTNWTDGGYASGLAIDGITIAGVPIEEANAAPEPGTIALFGLGLAGAVYTRRKRAA